MAKHQQQGPQDSHKLINRCHLLASGCNLKLLEFLGLNNNSLNSSVLSQVSVSNNRLLEAYSGHNLLKLGLALAKVRVVLCQEYSVSRQLDSGNNSSNHSLVSNHSRPLSLVNSNNKHPHSGSNLRLVSSLNKYLAPNPLIKLVQCLAQKL